MQSKVLSRLDYLGKKKLINVLEAHRGAYLHGVLHRDISNNNVRIVRDAEGRAKGILADWDMALEFQRDPSGNVIPPKAPRQRFRTVGVESRIDILHSKKGYGACIAFRDLSSQSGLNVSMHSVHTCSIR